MKKILMVDIYETESNVGDPDGKYNFQIICCFALINETTNNIYFYFYN